MAGYLFQPERALFHLAMSDGDAIVGIETLDDIAVVWSDGRQIREQDKHQISSRKPLPDKGKDLWNTLNIWLDAIDNEEIALQNTEFLLVTNQRLKSGLAFNLMHLADESSSRSAFIQRLREVGGTVSQTLDAIAKQVLSRNDQEIDALIGRIRVCDETYASSAQDLRQKIADRLHLPDSHRDDILRGLLGWVHDTALEMIRKGKPAWLSRAAFSEQYRRQMYRYQDLRFIQETEEALVVVQEHERKAQRSRVFVSQLIWIGIARDAEEVLEAIDDYLRCGIEANRLTELGVVQPSDFRAFESRLLKRWKTLRNLRVTSSLPKKAQRLEELGRGLLNDTMNHREPLAGQPTNEYYLTRGAYHRLADEPLLGWHPRYQAIFDALKAKLRKPK